MAELLVAIVDDDPSVRRAVGNLLASMGQRTESFASAEEFLARPNPTLPACLVLDLRMPGMQGIDLLKRLAASTPVPTVILTGHGDEDARRQALAAGARAFLTKPFKANDLLEAVRSALTTRGTHPE